MCIQASNPNQRQSGQHQFLLVLGTDAVKVPVVGYPAASGKRQLLREIPVGVEGIEGELTGQQNGILPSYTQGLLVHGLAAVQSLGERGGLLWILFGLGQGKPAGVFGFRVMQRVESYGQTPS